MNTNDIYNNIWNRVSCYLWQDGHKIRVDNAYIEKIWDLCLLRWGEGNLDYYPVMSECSLSRQLITDVKFLIDNK
jgi:hypothetical protein